MQIFCRYFQIFLMTDLLFGYLRRQYALEKGPKPKLDNGEVGQVTLDWKQQSHIPQSRAYSSVREMLRKWLTESSIREFTWAFCVISDTKVFICRIANLVVSADAKCSGNSVLKVPLQPRSLHTPVCCCSLNVDFLLMLVAPRVNNSTASPSPLG